MKKYISLIILVGCGVSDEEMLEDCKDCSIISDNYVCKDGKINIIRKEIRECIKLGLSPYQTEHSGELEDWDTEEIKPIMMYCKNSTLDFYCKRYWQDGLMGRRHERI